MLDGYGPIPPSMARRLIADGADSFYRVLTDPRDGAPLEIGRTSYRITKAPAAMAPAPRRQVPVPGLQQPLTRQRGRPPAGLGRRRHHRHLQPRTALPQTPPPQTPLRLDTHRRQQGRTAGLDFTVGTALPSEHQDWEPPLWPGHIFRIDDGPNRSIPRTTARLKDWAYRAGPAPTRSRTGTYSLPGTNGLWRKWTIRAGWCPSTSHFRKTSRGNLVCAVGAEADATAHLREIAQVRQLRN